MTWPPAHGLAALVCESTPSPGEHPAPPVRFFLAKILHRLLALVYAPLEGLERCRTTFARAIGRRMPSLGFGAPPPVGPSTPPCGAKANSQASRPPPPAQLPPQSPAQHTTHPPSASNLAGWAAGCRPFFPMRRASRRAAGTRTDRRCTFPATTPDEGGAEAVGVAGGGRPEMHGSRAGDAIRAIRERDLPRVGNAARLRRSPPPCGCAPNGPH